LNFLIGIINRLKSNQPKDLFESQPLRNHSMATANFNKSVWLVTNTTAASKYIPRRPRISIN
jgi:hypothetical protein